MSATRWILVFFMVGLVACQPEGRPKSLSSADSSPVPETGSGPPPMPMALGTTWEYEVFTDVPENAVELTAQWVKTRPLAGRRLRATRTTVLEGPVNLAGREALRFTTRVNDVVERVDYRIVSAEQIADVATDLLGPPSVDGGDPTVRQITFAEPLPLVRFPLEAGDNWQVRFHVDGHPVNRTFDVLGPETIQVPAGSFDTWCIRAVGSDRPGHTVESSFWFAPGIGFVKSRAIHTAAFGLLKIETAELSRGPEQPPNHRGP